MGAEVLVGGGSLGQLFQEGHEACEWKGYTYIVRCKTIDSTTMQWPNIMHIWFDAAAKHQSPNELFRILAESKELWYLNPNVNHPSVTCSGATGPYCCTQVTSRDISTPIVSLHAPLK